MALTRNKYKLQCFEAKGVISLELIDTGNNFVCLNPRPTKGVVTKILGRYVLPELSKKGAPELIFLA